MKKRVHHRVEASLLRDLILGGQDGLVNVLGIVLGIAAATRDVRLVIIAGLAATFAESLSMAAVAYTSMKAQENFYQGFLRKQKNLLHKDPLLERRLIYEVYYGKGFRGGLLRKIVDRVTSSEKMWLDTLMKESNLPLMQYSPLKSAFIVGFSAMFGSLIPLVPFFFIPIGQGIIFSVIISALSLFLTGALEGRITLRSGFNEGFRMMIIGLIAAFAGFFIGKWLGVVV